MKYVVGRWLYTLMSGEFPFVDVAVDAASEESGGLVAFHLSAVTVWPETTRRDGSHF